MQLERRFFHGGEKNLAPPPGRLFSGVRWGDMLRTSVAPTGSLQPPGHKGRSVSPDAEPKGLPVRPTMHETSATLLQRLLDHGDDDAWTRLTHLYTPLIRANLGRHLPQAADIDDLTQQVFTVVLEKLPEFRHSGRPGAFRAWLRGICVNRVRMFWRSRPASVPDPEAALRQLEDPDSALSRQWDREHDAFVFRRALEMIEGEFKPSTWQAFRRLALDNAEPEVVAAELGLTANAVFIARSRVLRRLRGEFAGLL
jgi:RNA polymerase sigma-70 factor (ECF subfamily)